jgi:ParB family chromosome partitioning protein
MVSTLERPAEVASLLQLDPRELIPDSRNERGEITPETDPDLEGLVASIHENGVLEPLRVYRGDLVTDYIISSGHRRRAAAILAGLEQVPCIVVAQPDGEARDIERLVANIQRRDIDVISKARTIKHLIDTEGIRQTALAAKLGMAQPTIANLVRLLKLPEEVQGLIAEGKLSAGHGQALLRLEEPVVSSEWVQGQQVFKETPAQEYVVRLAQSWLATATSSATSVRTAEDTIDRVLSNNNWSKTRRAEALKEAKRASAKPVTTVEELEAIQHEERRKRASEGRARTARVRTAYATMIERVKLPTDGAPTLEHLKLAAMAVKTVATYYDDPKIWEAAWGTADSRWDNTAYQQALDAASTPEEVLHLMCQQALYVVGIESTGDRMSYGSVSKYADKLFGIEAAIKKALAQKGGE